MQWTLQVLQLASECQRAGKSTKYQILEESFRQRQLETTRPNPCTNVVLFHIYPLNDSNRGLSRAVLELALARLFKDQDGGCSGRNITKMI